jgi:heterodisulfide reductase subunit A-like polyferredoxin
MTKNHNKIYVIFQIAFEKLVSIYIEVGIAKLFLLLLKKKNDFENFICLSLCFNFILEKIKNLKLKAVVVAKADPKNSRILL